MRKCARVRPHSTEEYGTELMASGEDRGLFPTVSQHIHKQTHAHSWSRTSHVCVPVCVREQQQLLWRCGCARSSPSAGCGDLVQTVQHAGRCFLHWVVVHHQTRRCKTMFVCMSLYVLSNKQYRANQTPSWDCTSILSCQNYTCHPANKISNENVW